MKKEFLTIDELKPIMNYFVMRLRNIRSLQNLINEYNDCDKNVRLLQSYRKYFETLYGSAGSMILIDLYNIFDNQPDTFAIDLVANRVLKSFDNLAKQVIPPPYTFAAKNYNKEEFQKQIGKINQSISGLTEKIRIIRNKEDLGHGMKYSFETLDCRLMK